MAQKKQRFVAYVRLDVELQVPLQAGSLADAVIEAQELTTGEVMEQGKDLVDAHSIAVTGVFRV